MTRLSAERGHVKFGPDDSFHRDVRSRVERYFRLTGRRERDCPQMYVKTAMVLAWAAASYVLLVFVATSWWLAVPAALSMAMAVAAIGFNVQHDGGHRAYSKHGWVNRWMARSLDLLGGSSFIWNTKHNTLHHTYANIDGHDDDIDVGIFGRLSPYQRRYPFHRIQHVYIWFLYGLLAIKWQLFDDFHQVARGRVGTHRMPRPRGSELAVFIGGKALFLSLAFVVPMLQHPVWLVLVMFVLVSAVNGFILSVVFQLAHVVEEVEFKRATEAPARIDSHWARHQVETTANFAPRNRLLTWYVGGLNYQIEHHLFPRVCHIHYPRLARIVQAASRRHGIRYNSHRSLFSSIASHVNWLRRMGQPLAV